MFQPPPVSLSLGIFYARGAMATTIDFTRSIMALRALEITEKA